jgi:PAS domain S-box-containing protein
LLTKFLFPSNLRSRLITLVLLVIVSAAALILTTALEERRLTIGNARDRLLQLARLATNEHEQLIEGARQLLIGLTHLPQVQEHQTAACNTLFRKLIAQFPAYTNLLAAKPNGEVFCSSAPTFTPFNIADRASFQRALETRNFTVSEYLIGRISGKPVITFSYASPDREGSIKAYVAIGMDLSWFNRVAAQTTLPSGATICILDRRGTVLAHYPTDHHAWMDQSVKQTPVMRSLLDRSEDMIEAVGLDGVTRFHVSTALQNLEEPSLFVSIGVLPDTVFVEANKALTRNLAGLGAIGFLALVGAWFGSELFYLRRVNTLLGVTQQLAAGNLSARTGLPGGRDELNQLACTIDEMAESLERLMAERRQGEEALREREQLYRAVVENVADGIGINVGRNRAFVNSAFLRIHGLDDPSQIVGSPLDLFIAPEDRNLVIERTLARQRGEPVPSVYEYRIVRPDGEVRTVQTSATPIVYQGQAAALVALRDRTEEQIAEQALRDSENKLRSVIETAIDAVVSIDNRGTIILFNQSAEDIFGYSAREVMGRPVTVLMPERLHSAYNQNFIRCVSTGQSTIIGRIVEIVGQRKNGSEFPIEISLSSWRSGNALYFTAFVRDITARKQAETTIHQLNGDLTQRTEELQAINRELEAFSYSVSHDLRAPLRAIDGFSKILVEDFAGTLPVEVQRLLHMVRNNTHQMAKLIDDLLDFARLGRQSFDCAVLDMESLTTSALNELGKADPPCVFLIKVHSLVPAQGNGPLVKQVLINLISNALKFSRVRSEPIVEIGCYANGKENTYYVKDNGVGFDMDYADKLFGVFQRLHSAHEFEGTGVGLAIVKRIINRHNGRVWAQAKANEGATFYFTLPAPREIG